MWEYIQTGGYLMVPLLACSVISLSVVFERIIFWFKCPGISHLNLFVTLLSEYKSQPSANPTELETKLNSYEKRLASSIVANDGNVSESFRLNVSYEIEKMNRGMMILSTVITLAPLLGILGTVVGIIDSFYAIGASSKANPQLVSNGIAQALITTAAGLSIAILTLIPFNYFQSRINQYWDSVSNIAEILEKR